MIEIVPAISVMYNKVARLNHSDLNDVVLYNDTPFDMALKFQDHGIKRLHLIDIDSAKAGKIVNTHTLEMISGYTDMIIDYGGGISDDDNIRLAFEYGANTIHAASVAVNNQDLFASWIISYGRNKVMLSVDAIEEKVITKGWANKTEIPVMDLIETHHTNGILYVKCSDVSKDGTMEGPSFDLYKKILNKFPGIKLFASGGVRSVEDIEQLQDLGVYGVIFARALYENKIQLKQLEKFLI